MPGAARCVGRYELIRRLGRGGMGVVHLARDPQDGREVAIKELALGLLDDPAAMRRFAREAAVVASLRHPHIVIAHELLWHDGVPSIVMEYLPGGSLRARVGRLTAGEAAEVLTGVLAGLGHAHAHGIVHRDLKPENLLFGDDDRVRIADFGIAKAAGDTLHSAPSGVLGSPVYLAPEQAAGGEVGPWTDLYAIGVIAYELFVGAPPFRGEAFPELLLRHAHSPVPAPRTVRPDLPVALERWLLGLLEKDPRRRPPDAATASHALQAIVGDRADGWRAAPPPAPPMAATTVIRPARKRRSLIARVPRRPAASVAAVAAAVALLIQTDWLGGLERTSVDARFAVRGTRRAASDPVIVGIDRASLAALKARWPVARGLHARVIDALRRDGARVIVYKVYFTVEGPSPEQDDRLIVAVKRATRHGTAVVLAGGQTMIGGIADTETRHVGNVFGGGEGLRYSGAVAAGGAERADPDGVVRHLEPAAGRPTLALAAAEIARGRAFDPSDIPAPAPWIDFAGGAGTIRMFSFAKVLKGEFPRGTFRHKIVVVGTTAPALLDMHRTSTSAAMSGPELTANEIATARRGFPLQGPGEAAPVLPVVLAAVPLLGALWRRRWVVVAPMVAAAAYVALAVVAFTAGTVLPVALPLASLGVGALAAGIVMGRPAREKRGRARIRPFRGFGVRRR